MQTGRCPKCGGSRIAQTRYVLYRGAGISGPNLALYVCADCHFAEHYVTDKVESLVSALDAWSWVLPDEGGPFRR